MQQDHLSCIIYVQANSPYPVILTSVLSLSINWQVNNQIINPRGLFLVRFSLWTCRNIYMVSACPLLSFTQVSSPRRSLLTKRIFMGYVAIVKLPLSCPSKKSTWVAGKILCESQLMKQLGNFEPLV